MTAPTRFRQRVRMAEAFARGEIDDPDNTEYRARIDLWLALILSGRTPERRRSLWEDFRKTIELIDRQDNGTVEPEEIAPECTGQSRRADVYELTLARRRAAQLALLGRAP